MTCVREPVAYGFNDDLRIAKLAATFTIFVISTRWFGQFAILTMNDLAFPASPLS